MAQITSMVENRLIFDIRESILFAILSGIVYEFINTSPKKRTKI